MTIGEKIKEIREAKGLTLGELSILSGIPADILEKYEKNTIKPHFVTLLKLSDVLDVNISVVHNETLNKASCEAAAAQVFKDENDGDETEEEIAAEFGNALAALRKLKGVSVKTLAENTGLTIDEINDYEKTNCAPDVTALVKIADYFCVPSDLLLGRIYYSESEKEFFNFVTRIEKVAELYRNGILPEDLYISCRDAIIAEFI